MKRSNGFGFPPPVLCFRSDDVIVVASVSCIYGLGSPEDYANMVCAVSLRVNRYPENCLLAKLVDMLYERNDIALTRGRFRARGDVVEVHPATFDDEAIRIEFFGDEIDLITRFDPLTGQTLGKTRPIHLLSGQAVRDPARQNAAGAQGHSGGTR